MLLKLNCHMALDYFQLPNILIHGIEPQTLGSLIIHLNYSEEYIYITYIVTVRTTYIQCYGVILAAITLVSDKYYHIHLHVMTILGSFHSHIHHSISIIMTYGR